MARGQEELPTIENTRIIKPLTEAIEVYQKLKTSRIKTLTKEIEAKEEVVALMNKHNITVYRDDDLTATLVPGKAKLKVREGEEAEVSEDC